MAQLVIHDVTLVLRDMFTNRKEALRQSAVAQSIYEKQLRARLHEIEGLPAALTGRPLSEELTAEDAIHDGFGRAIYYLTEAYQHLPGVDAAVSKAARAVREALIPQLGDLTRDYATEAAAAHAHDEALAGLKADLKRLPVVGGTVGDWAVAFVASGKRIDGLLSQRGDATASVDPEARRKVGPLRSATLGVLRRFRDALADELEANPHLPRNLDAQIFGYLDELTRQRQAQGSASAKGATPPSPHAPAPPTL